MRNGNITLVLSYTNDEIETLMSMPFYQAIEYWVLRNNEEESSKESTKNDRLFKLRVTERIIEECPNEISSKRIDEILRKDLDFMFKVLTTNKKFNQKPSTMVKWYKFINMIYTNLIQCRVITVTPTYGWKITNHPNPQKTEIIDRRILSAFMDIKPKTYEQFRNLALYAFLSDTAIRIGSLSKIVYDNLTIIEISGKRVVTNIKIIDAKYGVNYEVSVGKKSSDILIAYIDRRPKTKDNTLFLKKDGKPLTYAGYRQIFLRRSNKIGCSHPITPHMFRATSATYLAGRIKDIGTLKYILGVKSDDVAYRYIRDGKAHLAKLENRELSLVDGLFADMEQKELANNVDNALNCDSKYENSGFSMDSSININQIEKNAMQVNPNMDQLVNNLLNDTYKEALKQLMLQSNKSVEKITMEAGQLLQVYKSLVQTI